MKLSSFAPGTRQQSSRTLTPGAAISRIDREQAKREFGETPSLELLGREDELSAQIPWLEARKRAVSDVDRNTLRAISEEIERRRASEPETMIEADIAFRLRNRILDYFPDTGPLRRELYVKHMQFFAAGLTHRERLFLAANKVGKSDGAGCEVSWHVTGRYPKWWEGYRFDEPVDAWIVNKSAKDSRDINEAVLLGPVGDPTKRGTGLLPGHLIVDTTPKPGTPSGFEFIDVRHISGGVSQIQSKSFDQGRESFQGRNKKLIWLDEEVPQAIYTECLLRTMTSGGIVIVTYTPIMGLTELTTQFLEEVGISLDQFSKSEEEDG